MGNPYEILGVSQGSSDEEIREAYRRLARQYHPDNCNSDFEKQMAEKRMQEINSAYDQIIQMRRDFNGSSYRRADKGSYNSYNTSGLGDVREKINQGRLDDAQTILDGIPHSNRTAEWHYLKGTILHRRGWFNEASVNFEDACRMEPNNREYRAAYESSRNARNGGYRQERYRHSNVGGCSGCDICQGLICADCCCECMGGDLIRCC